MTVMFLSTIFCLLCCVYFFCGSFKLLYILRWPFALVMVLAGIPVAAITSLMEGSLVGLKQWGVIGYVYLFDWGRGL